MHLTPAFSFQKRASCRAYVDRDSQEIVTLDQGGVPAPILLYLASRLCHLIPMIDADIPVVDGRGKIWSSADIRETAAIVALFTMLPTSGLALLRLAQRHAALDPPGRASS